jgi:hypothetical protein
LTDSEILKRLEDIERKIVNIDGKLNRIESARAPRLLSVLWTSSNKFAARP